MTKGKKILCKCGHARSYHCRKVNPFTHKFWWGVCYHKEENRGLCSCIGFEEVQK